MQNTRKVLVISILVVILIVIGLIAGDLFARNYAQNKASDAVTQISGLSAENEDISVHGWPFLPQLISGKLSSVDIKADALNYKTGNANIRLENADFTIQGLSTSEPYHADALTGKALLTTQSLQNLVTAQGLKMQVKNESGQIKLLADILGVPVTVFLKAEPGTATSSDLSRTVPAVKLTPTDVSLNIAKLANKKPEAQSQEQDTKQDGKQDTKQDNKQGDKKQNEEAKPKRDGSISLSNILDNLSVPSFTIPIEQAPNGLEINKLEVNEQGIYFEITGNQLNLSEAAGMAMPTQNTPAASEVSSAASQSGVQTEQTKQAQ